MEKTSQNRVFKKIPVGEVPAALRNLTAALLQKGFSHAQIQEVFASDLTAICSDCRLIFSGRELSQIASGENIGSFQKLARLSRGDCGRRDCPSSTYELGWIENEKVSWETLWEAAAAIGAQAETEQTTAHAASLRLAAIGQKRKLAVAILLSLLAIVAIYWRFRAPSWSTRPSTYQVDPQSLQPPPP